MLDFNVEQASLIMQRTSFVIVIQDILSFCRACLYLHAKCILYIIIYNIFYIYMSAMHYNFTTSSKSHFTLSMNHKPQNSTKHIHTFSHSHILFNMCISYVITIFFYNFERFEMQFCSCVYNVWFISQLPFLTYT